MRNAGLLIGLGAVAGNIRLSAEFGPAHHVVEPMRAAGLQAGGCIPEVRFTDALESCVALIVDKKFGLARRFHGKEEVRAFAEVGRAFLYVGNL